MVSGVQNSLGSTAYLKGSQLGQKPESTAKQRAEIVPSEVESSRPARETERTERSSESNDNRTAKRTDTQLEARNDETTIRTEQARGSLLDLAV